ncbi:MAG: hydantoinase/oxoprolinase family protein [Deltaproteobacteria bacterium]|nr:hydantoinase/oxoprolinase family protein [Deltaproteobacteria bacterium]
MDYVIGIDVGGTFTDFVVLDPSQRLFHGKVPSTPRDESEGILAAIQEVSKREKKDFRALLAETDLIILGTTVVTNTMLQFNGSKTGMITTRGFRDVIELRGNYKESLFDLKLPPPYPIVPRRSRLGVTERIDYTGRVIVELDEQELRGAVDVLKEAGVESIAVGFLFSYVNPLHELCAREIIREVHPEATVSLSHEILPQVREFERFSTTVVNAYVSPHLKRYLTRLTQRLKESDFRGELFIMQSNGGMMHVDFAAARGVEAALSGPSGGVVAGAYLGKLIGFRDLITMDMGGTSYDVCVIKAGRPELSSNYWMSRYRIGLPMIDIHTIGAGGGSIAWVDKGGGLRVGPQSAGADPGPACYGLGGKEPTVTDADVVLGYIDPDYFLAGRVKLDVELAKKAIEEKVAKPLGLSLMDAASGIFRIVNNNMNNAIRYVSVMRGRDPRDFALMAFGGAGPVHAGAQVRDLKIKTILVPKTAPMFSALGAVLSDFKISRVQSLHMRSTDPRVEPLNDLFQRMYDDAVALLGAGRKDVVRIDAHRFMDLRYIRQVHEVTIELPHGERELTLEDLRRLFDIFHDRHEALYAFKRTNFPVEIINLRLDVVGVRKPVELERIAANGGAPAAALKGTRPVYFEDLKEYVETAVYDGSSMKPGQRVAGPAIVEEPETTLVVLPGQELTLDPYQTYVIACQ